MHVIPHWFWLIGVGLLGGCVGSFLNVVIYRLARGLSVATPARSFCPGCAASIAWYDNVPIASYLALRGRCRHCQMPISPRYPLIEGLTVLLFLLAYDTFFVGPARPAFVGMAADWPIFVGHLVLLAALVAVSAIDIEGYWIDVTITYSVVVVGVVAHGLWTPTSSADFLRPGPDMAFAAVGATVGLAAMLLLWPRHPLGEDEPIDGTEPPSSAPSPSSEPAGRSGSGLWLAVLVSILIAAWVGLAVIDADRPEDPSAYGLRAGLVILACFASLVAVGMDPTEAEADIVEAIDDERPTARREAAIELGWLSPAIVLSVVGCWLGSGALGEGLLAWSPFGGDWRPILGLSTALTGFALAGAIGWGVRIVFTLILGREAFGMGDVHLMAAAGAVAGWPIVMAGFFLACPLAVVAVGIWLIRKRSRAVWFGPWLSLGIVVALVLYLPLAERVGTMLEAWEILFGLGAEPVGMDNVSGGVGGGFGGRGAGGP